MSKHLIPEILIDLPSGQSVHPCRFIHKDGTLLWKDALHMGANGRIIPSCQAHEAHIIKTASRLEELSSWVTDGLEFWEGFHIHAWYRPTHSKLSDGISVYFTHRILPCDQLLNELAPRVLEHEALSKEGDCLYFKRC